MAEHLRLLRCSPTPTSPDLCPPAQVFPPRPLSAAAAAENGDASSRNTVKGCGTVPHSAPEGRGHARLRERRGHSRLRLHLRGGERAEPFPPTPLLRGGDISASRCSWDRRTHSRLTALLRRCNSHLTPLLGLGQTQIHTFPPHGTPKGTPALLAAPEGGQAHLTPPCGVRPFRTPMSRCPSAPVGVALSVLLCLSVGVALSVPHSPRCRHPRSGPG